MFLTSSKGTPGLFPWKCSQIKPYARDPAVSLENSINMERVISQPAAAQVGGLLFAKLDKFSHGNFLRPLCTLQLPSGLKMQCTPAAKGK